jgi:hypothetical protein
MPGSGWFRHAPRVVADPRVLRRALFTSLVVGLVLTGVRVFGHHSASGFEVVLTFVVPFVVSVAWSWAAIARTRTDTRLLEREVQALNRFPDQNPHPVMRLDREGVLSEGELIYANAASAVVRRGFGIDVGGSAPAETFARLRQIADAGRAETVEVEAGGRVVALLPVWVPEFGFINVYGTDITAAREVERAHGENQRLLLNILPATIASAYARASRRSRTGSRR